MIFGDDLSYCSYNNDSIVGSFKLYESDIVTAHDVVTIMHYSYASCKNIEEIRTYDYKIDSTYTIEPITYEFNTRINNIYYTNTYTGYIYTYDEYIAYYNGCRLNYLEDASGLFKDCTSLKHADLSYLNLTNCINLDEAFKGCYNLETVRFGSEHTNSLLHCENIFRDCYNLSMVYIPFDSKNEYLNISEQTHDHTYYYVHEEVIPLSSYSYTYYGTKTMVEDYRIIKFKLFKIGALIIEDNLSDWTSVRIYVNDELIFENKKNYNRPANPLYGSEIVLNNFLVNQTTDIKLYNSWAVTEAEIRINLFKGLEIIQSISTRLPYNKDNELVEFSIDSILLTKPETIINYIQFSPDPTDIVAYTRNVTSEIRANFMDNMYYNYPDGDMITEVNAKTGEITNMIEAKIDPNMEYSYLIVNAKPQTEEYKYAYMVQLDNTKE